VRVLGAAQHAALGGGQRCQARGDVVALAADLRVLLLDGVELTQLAPRQGGERDERGLDRAQGGGGYGRRRLGLRGRALRSGGRSVSQLVVVGPAGRRPAGQLRHGEVLVVTDGHALRRPGEHVAALRARPGRTSRCSCRAG
jgi:hypothetical protein